MSIVSIPLPIPLHIPRDHPAFDGHFPQRALLPGVALLAEVLELAWARPELRARLGDRGRVGTVKFLAPVLPGAMLTVWLHDAPRELRFEVREGDELAATGHFEVPG